jgi:hypothetical protein
VTSNAQTIRNTTFTSLIHRLFLHLVYPVSTWLHPVEFPSPTPCHRRPGHMLRQVPPTRPSNSPTSTITCVSPEPGVAGARALALYPPPCRKVVLWLHARARWRQLVPPARSEYSHLYCARGASQHLPHAPRCMRPVSNHQQLTHTPSPTPPPHSSTSTAGGPRQCLASTLTW